MDAEFVPMMTDAELDEALEKAVEFGRAAINNQPRVKNLPPVVLVHTYEWNEVGVGAAEVGVYIMRNFDSAHGDAMLRAVGAKAARDLLITRTVFFVAAGWFSVSTVAPGQPGYCAPQDAPDRKEVLIVAGMSADRRAVLGHVAVHRDEAGYLEADESVLFPREDRSAQVAADNILAAFFAGYEDGIGGVVTEWEVTEVARLGVTKAGGQS